MDIEASSRDRHPGVGKGQEFIEGVKEVTHKYTLRKRQEDNAFVVQYSKRTDMIYPDEDAARKAFKNIENAKEVSEDTEDEQQTEEQKREKANEQAREHRSKKKEEEDYKNISNPKNSNSPEPPPSPDDMDVVIPTEASRKANLSVKGTGAYTTINVYLDGCEPVDKLEDLGERCRIKSKTFNDEFEVSNNRISNKQREGAHCPVAYCKGCHARYWGNAPQHTTDLNDAAEHLSGAGYGMTLFRCPGCGSEVGVASNMLGTGEQGTYIGTGKQPNPMSLLSTFKKYLSTNKEK